jgi:hypothetical protein
MIAPRTPQRLFAALCIVALAVTLTTHAQSSADKRTLKNDDVVSLVKAGLSESAIITLIQKSQDEFDLSPAALVKLKEAGVTNAVIEVMLGGSPANSPAPAAAPSLPTAYGFYLLDDSKVLTLQPSAVTTKIGLSPRTYSYGGIAVDGIAGDPPVSAKSGAPTVIIYQQAMNMNALHFGKLTYVNTMQAYQFNMNKTDPRFFANVYGKGYNDIVEVGLWRPGDDLPVRVEPVEGRQGMFKIIPASPLQPGRYVIYFGDNIHQDGIIFATRSDRSAGALYFGKEGEEKENYPAPTGLTSPVLTTQPPTKP